MNHSRNGELCTAGLQRVLWAPSLRFCLVPAWFPLPTVLSSVYISGFVFIWGCAVTERCPWHWDCGTGIWNLSQKGRGGLRGKLLAEKERPRALPPPSTPTRAPSLTQVAGKGVLSQVGSVGFRPDGLSVRESEQVRTVGCTMEGRLDAQVDHRLKKSTLSCLISTKVAL